MSKKEKPIQLDPEIIKNAEVLPVEEGVLILDKNNPLHKEWIED